MTDIDVTNTDWYTKPTGDPFADVGGYVIEYFQEKFPDKNILELISEATTIYVKDWENNLHSFFLNSTITHNSNKGQKAIDKTLEYFKNLLEGNEPVQQGYCRITGQNTRLFLAGRDNFMMSGSGTFINFHHAFQQGILLSKEAIIRVFFSPLGLMQLGNNVALIQSNNETVTKFFVKSNLDDNFRDLASGISKSIQKSEFTNPANALFDFADKCITDLIIATQEEEGRRANKKGVILNLYHFTSFGASPAIQLYALPAVVFEFYRFCLRSENKKDWKRFINRHFHSSKFKDAHFNEATDQWENKKGSVGYGEFKTWRNPVYEKLLQGKSLLWEFRKWSTKNRLNFRIVEVYQQSIKDMDKRTLEIIKNLADFIIQDGDSIKKSVTKLNGMKKAYEMRQFLLHLIAKNYKEGGDKPLLTLEEYVEYLFPDGTSSRDIRDLLLIAIYQRLHETNTSLEIEYPEEQDIESETLTE
jgi:CRISPR-associated protein Cst1